MDLYFTANSRDGFNQLQDSLKDSKIKYSVYDDDTHTLQFKVKADQAADFQNDMVSNILGATIPGSFTSQI